MTPGFVIEVAINQAKKMGLRYSNVMDIGWADEYADGRSSPKGIAFGNWNDDERCEGEKHTFASDLPSRVCDILEKMGVEIEWSDMVSTCDECGKLVQTEPDCHFWKPAFVVGDDGLRCEACVLQEV